MDDVPKKRQVGDINGNRGLSHIPVHVDIRYERWYETIDLIEDGRNNDEDAHAKYAGQYRLLLAGNLELKDDRNPK